MMASRLSDPVPAGMTADCDMPLKTTTPGGHCATHDPSETHQAVNPDFRESADYATLLQQDLPLLDVRSPVEFAKGSLPRAVNLPLMNDEERHLVGLCYQHKGQQAAIDLGLSLVTGSLRQQRIDTWVQFVQAHPLGHLYCFRGGLRSRIAQQWLAQAGYPYPRITGGYKAVRHFLLDQLQQGAAQPLIVLGGLTGTGKTEVLTQLAWALDLEDYAGHRGSSFGKRVQAQPSQIDFEHRLALRLLESSHRHLPHLVVEDEGQFIGHCALPSAFYQHMQQAPLVWLEDDLSHRVQRILSSYVIEVHQDFVALRGAQQGFIDFAQHLRHSLAGIAKRLGGERTQRVQQHLESALSLQASDGSVTLHSIWIEILLREYYDPMYLYQAERKEPRIRFRGRAPEVLDYLRQQQRLDGAGRMHPGTPLQGSGKKQPQ